MKNKITLIIIMVLASILRLVSLDQYPSGLNADEASIGYNAYSLIQTGKDEFGHPWPTSFQSFNDYKPGLYFYLVLPFVKILGLNEWAVRLPSALLGTLTVYLVYWLTKFLFNNKTIGLFSGLLLAVNPWHLHFSRGGWESNASLTFTVIGVCLLILGLNNRTKLTLGLLAMLASMYTYHSARLVTPLFMVGIGIYWLKSEKLSKLIKSLIIPAGIAILFSLPLIINIFSGGASRFSGVGLFADTGPFWRANEMRAQHSDYLALVPTMLHNKYLEYGFRFIDNYLRHFSGDYLFISGDEIQRNRVPETGQLLLIQIPLLLFGTFYLIKNGRKETLLIFWWLIVAPIASALTFQSPHAIRSLNMVIPLTIISGYGLYCLLNLLKVIIRNRFLLTTVHCTLITVFLWNTVLYFHQYYIHYPQTYPSAWEYGFKPLANYLKENQGKYDQIYITDRYDQPYILTAFYLQYPPELFQKEAKLTDRDQYGFSTVKQFGKYTFGSIDLNNAFPPNSLIVGTPSEIAANQGIIKRILYPDNKQEAFRLIER